MDYSDFSDHPPDGYRWIEDIAADTQLDLMALVDLCEREAIQAAQVDGRWAIRVVRDSGSRTLRASNVIVWDMRRGRDTSIGSMASQASSRYPYPDQPKRKNDGMQLYREQMPIHTALESAQSGLTTSWYLLAGGAFLVGIGAVLVCPIVALISGSALQKARQAHEMAQDYGDWAVIQDAASMVRKLMIVVLISWGVTGLMIMVFCSVLS